MSGISDRIVSPIKDPFPTRYSLLSRLQNGNDQESWRDFFETYWKLIYSIAIKAGLTETEAEDVIQETVISVTKHIHKFKCDRSLGSFKSWLRNIIRWRIADQLKKRLPCGKEFEEDPSPDELPDQASLDFENEWEQEWKNNLLDAAMERVKRRVKEEHFLMFERMAIKRLPVREIARTFGVSAGQVYLAKHRVSALLKKEIRRLEREFSR